MQGLANRRTGATSANADSSRSHCVFTCVIKSESKVLTEFLPNGTLYLLIMLTPLKTSGCLCTDGNKVYVKIKKHFACFAYTNTLKMYLLSKPLTAV